MGSSRWMCSLYYYRVYYCATTWWCCCSVVRKDSRERRRELLRGSSELIQVFYWCWPAQHDLSSGGSQMEKVGNGTNRHSLEESRSYVSLSFISVTFPSLDT